MIEHLITERSTELAGIPIMGQRVWPEPAFTDWWNGPKQFKAELDALFDMGVTAVRWPQYTPHFDDGNACVFEPGAPEFRLDRDVPDSRPYRRDWYQSSGVADFHYPERTFTPKQGFETLYYALKAFDNHLNNYSAMLLIAFGDHCRVTATREEFDVEAYDHD